MPTSLAQGIRQAARDQEAARLARDSDGSSLEHEDPGPRRLLGNAPIRYKLWAILVVPIAATVLFAALQIGQSTQEARSAEQVQSLANLGVKVSALSYELQQERGNAANLLGQQVPADQLTFETQSHSTDSAITDYREEMASLSGDAAQPVIDALRRVDDQLKALPTLRTAINDHKVPQAAATFRYTSLITDLLDINEAIADATNDREISDRVRATAAFSKAKEFASQEEAIVFEVLAQGHFQPGQYRDFVNSLANQEAALVQFSASATPEQRHLLDQTLTRSLVQESTDLESQAVRGENAPKLNIEQHAWFTAMTKKLQLQRQVEEQLGRNVVDVSGKLKEDALRQSLIQIGLVLLTFIIALTISLVVARSMVRPLTRLRSSALEVANHSLPEVVRRLRDAEEQAPDFAGMRNSQNGLDEVMIDPIELRSNDEIGQVARAFNAVHLEAVRVASEQAQLRRSVSTMFVNLSRRSQLLVDRLIRLIDNLEQGEQDPDRLADLFKLDHLATRMRRNDENLLVLAGADAGRRWNQPASLVDVLRAATAEVEQYTRVRLGNVDDSIEVAAKAVNDMVHLVAELLENATSFSSPRTDVVIDARRVGDQAIIEIEDQGIGMSPQQMEELNDRLAKPPVFDVSVSRMMGLFVVGRLASRHSVRVALGGATGGGTMAVVTLTADVLTRPAPLRPAAPPAEQPTQPMMTKRVEAERTDTVGVRPDLASKDEPRAIPTIDSTVVQSNHLPALPTRGPGANGLPARPAAEAPGGPVRAISSRPTALPPAASATESATGQYVQLGPIAEPVSAPPTMPPMRPPTTAEPATAQQGATAEAAPQSPAAPTAKPSLGVSSAAAAMAVLRGSQPTGDIQPPTLFGERAPAAESASAPPLAKRPIAPDRAAPDRTTPERAAAPERATPDWATESVSVVPPAPSVVPPAPSVVPPAPDRRGSPEYLIGRSDPANMDPTVEMPLPIFDAIESEWFRSSGQRQLLEPTSFADIPIGRAAATAAPSAAPPVMTPPVMTPPVMTPPVMTPPVMTPPVMTPPVMTPPAASVGTAPAAAPRPASPPTAAPSTPIPPSQRPAAGPMSPAAAPGSAPTAPAASASPAGTVSDSRLGNLSVSGRPVVGEPAPARPASDMPKRPSPRPDQAASTVPPAPSVATPKPAEAAPTASTAWSSPADAGWKAAQAAAETKPDASTGSGLPKRVPMAHFVPGRVDQPSQRKAPRPTTHRSPDAVRGVLSSYRHGLEQGRQATRPKYPVGTERENEQEEK